MRKNIRINDDLQEENILNLTPLIDVVFVVLVAFIIIAPMLQIDSIDLAEGISQTPLENPSNIRIDVQKDNSILLNNKKIELQNLKNALIFHKNQYPKQIPQLFHDRKAEFGIYQQIKNAAEASGFEEIQVILKP